MELKTNYFKINAIDCEESLAQYLRNADENYVILFRGVPDMWGNGMPVIYGDSEVASELSNCNAFGKVDGYLKDDYKVMTEQDFLFEFCFDELVKAIVQLLKVVGEKADTNLFIHYLDGEKFNGCIDKGGVTDVIKIQYDETLKELTALISTPNDELQYFVFLDELPHKVFIDIVDSLISEAHRTEE